MIPEKREQGKLKKLILKRIPILQWLPAYSKSDCISDVIAGITLGLKLVPQSMAYAMLAGLPPQYGLYSALLGPFLYIFLGTVKEVVMGPGSLLAIFTFAYTEDLPIDYKILLTFLCGIVELLIGILGMGFTVDFISVPVISGFTSASAVIIILSQSKALLGIKFKNGNIFHDVKQFIVLAPTIHRNDSILGACSIGFLLIFRKFSDIKSKNKIITNAFWILSISRSAIIVLISSCITYYYESNHGGSPFTMTGTVTQGIPIMKLPHFSTTTGNKTVTFVEMVEKLGSGFIAIPIVSILTNIAIAKTYSAGKIVDATQEIVTLGLCNILCSFVQAIPITGAFTRSAVANASGIRTPMAGIYTGTIILLALTFLTPFFYYVPKSTLAAVLISAVVFMINYQIIPILWRTKKYDLLVMAATFSVCLAFGLQQGLFVGMLLNLLPMIKSWARPKIQFSVEMNKREQEYLNVKPELGLCFCGSDYFTQEIVKYNLGNSILTTMVIDCSNVIDVDYTVALSVKTLIQSFKARHQEILFLSVQDSVINGLKAVIEPEDLHICNSIKELDDAFDEIDCDTSKDVQMALLSIP